MRIPTRTLLLAGLCVAAAACQPTDREAETREDWTVQDSTDIAALFDRLKAAGGANDWTAWTAEYTADAVRLPPNSGALRGTQAIMDWNDSFPTVTAFDFTVERLMGGGDVAVGHGSFTLSAAVADTAPAVEDRGKFMTAFRKQADGSWKIVADIWNSDLPVP